MRLHRSNLNGLGQLSVGPQGLGDINSDAQAKFSAAGYTNVACAPQQVCNPLGCYTLNQCTDDQSINMNADAAAGMSVAQLKTQLAVEKPYIGASDASIDQQILALATGPRNTGANNGNPFGASPPQTIIKSGAPVAQTAANNASTGSASSSLSDWQAQLNSILSGLAPSGSSAGLAPTAATPTTTTIIPGVPDMYTYIGLGLAAFLLLKK